MPAETKHRDRRSGYHNALIFMPYGDRHKHTRRQMHEGLNAHVVHQYHSLVEDSIFRFLGEMLHGQGELGQRIRLYVYLTSSHPTFSDTMFAAATTYGRSWY